VKGGEGGGDPSLLTPPSRHSQVLDRSLGQDGLDGAALEDAFGAAADVQGDVLVADLDDLAELAAGGDDFVALLQGLPASSLVSLARFICGRMIRK
jgi:hypothetical protein